MGPETVFVSSCFFRKPILPGDNKKFFNYTQAKIVRPSPLGKAVHSKEFLQTKLGKTNLD